VIPAPFALDGRHALVSGCGSVDGNIIQEHHGVVVYGGGA
jgi:hypothetical protein